jgi:hypothetical protein
VIAQALGLRLIDVCTEFVRLARSLSPSAHTYIRVVPDKTARIRMPNDTAYRNQRASSDGNEKAIHIASAAVRKRRVQLPASSISLDV